MFAVTNKHCLLFAKKTDYCALCCLAKVLPIRSLLSSIRTESSAQDDKNMLELLSNPIRTFQLAGAAGFEPMYLALKYLDNSISNLSFFFNLIAVYIHDCITDEASPFRPGHPNTHIRSRGVFPAALSRRPSPARTAGHCPASSN